MANTLRKMILAIPIPVLACLIAVNTYVATANLIRLQKMARHRAETGAIATNISGITLDLAAMESAQRGYLLTGDPAYLEPYADANNRLPTAFNSLRASMTAASTSDERTSEARLESVVQSILAEMQESIRLRQTGYRHRAFVLIGSNRGKELMDEARGLLSTLSAAQAKDIARHEKDLAENARRAYQELALSSALLLVITVVTLLALNIHAKRLQASCTEATEELLAARDRLQRFTTVLSQDCRALVLQTSVYADVLLERYGGFLPRHGQEQAQSISEAAYQMDRLLDGLLEESRTEKPEPAPGPPNKGELATVIVMEPHRHESANGA